ncbi:MAG TPA: MBL fold metallo-hydrolase [Flavobacteriales bacterium]|nr:MBL fold metallo-hydrolase [Flavobacteriales bacterium]
MSLYIASINSGSNGNCYYVGNATEAVLVDAGISCREIERRMKRIGLNIGKVKALFVSHEHTDHIRGIEVLAKKYHLPVYMTKKTFRNSGLKLDGTLVRFFDFEAVITIGDLLIRPFSKVHDAIDPCSFLVSGHGVNVGVITDIGIACENVKSVFNQCHAVFLEANYDVKMLEEGRYPWHLKNRIRGGRGHISNDQALELFTSHRPAHLSHLLLSHLSKENNDPVLVKELFEACAGPVSIIVASRYRESDVFKVDFTPVAAGTNKGTMAQPVQTTLF